MSQKNFSTKSWNLILLLAVMVILLYFYIFQSEKSRELDPLIIDKYRKQSHERAAFLNNSINVHGYGALYNALVPEVFCKDLIRVGQVGDGGKWICNPTTMLKWPDCKIYSLGINNDPSFEEDLQALLNNTCKVRSVDKDGQMPATLQRINNVNGIFKKALIGGKRNESANIYTFNDILSEFGDKRIDILKIDIEGGEFDIINELVSVPMCQILIEIHGKTPLATLEMLQTFSKNGFYLYSYEINGFFHELSEYSFIHKKCLSLFNVDTVLAKYLTKK